MKAFLPSQFLQVALHVKGANEGQPARLDKLVVLLEENGFNPQVDIDLASIADSGLLLLPTRQARFPFKALDLKFTVDYVRQGNPLFHLSNHPPLTREDSRLGEQLGYRFHSAVRGSNPLSTIVRILLQHVTYAGQQDSMIQVMP